MAERDIRIVLSVQDDGTVVLRNFGREVEALDARAGGAALSLRSRFALLSAAFLGFTAAFGAAALALGKAARAASEQEQAQAKLENVVKRVNGETEREVTQLTDLAEALQRTTLYGSAQIINAQALLSTFRLNADAVALLTPHLLDLATAIQGTSGETLDLKGVTVALGKAFNDGLGSLKRYGLTMTDAEESAFRFATTSEKVAILTRVLESNFKGMAAAAGGTFAGQLEIMRNALGDAIQELGNAVIKNEDVRKAIAALTATFQGWVQQLKENGPAVRAFVSDMVSFARGMVSAAESVVSVVYHLSGLLKVILGLYVLNSVAGLFAGLLIKLNGLAGGVSGLSAVLLSVGRAMLAAFGGPVLLIVGAAITAFAGLTSRIADASAAAADFGEIQRLTNQDISKLSDEALKKLQEDLTRLKDRYREAATEAVGFWQWLLFGDRAQQQASENYQRTADFLARISLEMRRRSGLAAQAAKDAKAQAAAEELPAAAIEKVKAALAGLDKYYDAASKAASQFFDTQANIAEALSQQRLIDIEANLSLSDAERARQRILEERRAAGELIAIERQRVAEALRIADVEAARKQQHVTREVQNATQRAERLQQIDLETTNKKIEIYTKSQNDVDRLRQQALNREQQHAQRVISLTNQIRDANISASEVVFRLYLRTLNEEDRLNALAVRALALTGEAAIRAWEEWANAGGDVETAIRNISIVNANMVNDLARQRDEAEKAKAEEKARSEALLAQYQQIGNKIAELVDQRAELGADIQANMTILTNAGEAFKVRNELAKDIHTNHYIHTIQANRWGGLIQKFARGGRLPGYGGGDRVRALLEPGEFVLRKEAVKRYGRGLLEMLNNLMLPTNIQPARMALGGLVKPVGTPSASANLGTLRFDFGGRTAAVRADGDAAELLRSEFGRLARQGRSVRRI